MEVHKKIIYTSLEGLRFLSSVAIVLWHYVPYLYPEKSVDDLWISQFYLAVDLFFVISGIVIAGGYFGRLGSISLYGRFIQRRIARLYPLHLATLGFYVLVGLLSTFGIVVVSHPEKYNFSELLPNLLMTHAWGMSSDQSFNYVSWSISAEFFVYLIFPILGYIVTRGMIWGAIVVISLLIWAIAVSAFLLGQPLTQLTWNFSIVRAIPSFALGIWIFYFRADLLRLLTHQGAWIAFQIMAATLIAMLILHANEYFILFAIYGLVATAFLCDVEGRKTFVSWQPISSLGYLTYSIYMLHTVTATVIIRYLFPKLFGHSSIAVISALVVSAICTFVLAAASHRYFEVPAQRLINSVKTSRISPQ